MYQRPPVRERFEVEYNTGEAASYRRLCVSASEATKMHLCWYYKGKRSSYHTRGSPRLYNPTTRHCYDERNRVLESIFLLVSKYHSVQFTYDSCQLQGFIAEVTSFPVLDVQRSTIASSRVDYDTHETQEGINCFYEGVCTSVE